MAVAAHQDLHFGPVHADAAYDMTQNVRDLLARRPLAGTDQRQHGLARSSLEDLDRLEAGGADMRIEEREFLLAARAILRQTNGFVAAHRVTPHRPVNKRG